MSKERTVICFVIFKFGLALACEGTLEYIAAVVVDLCVLLQYVKT